MLDKQVGLYTIGEEIGRGSFAVVSKGHHIRKDTVVAVKSVVRSKLTSKLLQNLEGEITIMKSLKHDHIVQLIDCQQTKDYIHLIMDYCALGDLSQFIKRRNRFEIYGLDMARVLAKYPPGAGGGLNEHLAKHFLRQLASAVRFLRSKNLIHRDLKPQNLLLVPPTSPNDLPILKVADFGFSRYLPKTSLAETLCGSPLYMAPEILRCQQYGAEVDLWSIGTVLYEMLVGKPPFRAQNHVELLVRIDKGDDRIRFPGEKDGVGGVSEPLKELCRDLLKKDPKDRMTFQKFFAHPCVVQEETTGSSEEGRSDGRVGRRRSSASDRATPPRSPTDEHHRGTAADYFPATRGTNPMPQSPSHEATVNFPTQARRVSPPYDVTGPPLQHRRISLTSQRPPLNVETRTSPPLHHGTSPSSRYAPELERNPSLRSNSGNLGTSTGKASPGSSYLQQRYRPRTPEDTPVAPGTASLEVDYVLVESRQAVEVNALADELAYSPQQRNSTDKTPNPRYNALIKRGTSYAVANTGTSPVATTTQARNPRAGLPTEQRTVSAPVYSHVPGSQSPSPTGYIPSERRFGTSPSSALAKAISIASMKLFGTSSPSPPYSQSHHPTDRGTIIKASSGSQEEESAVRDIEDIALRSNVVYQFAEMKLSQIIPISSSSSGGVPSSPSGRRDSWKNSILTDEADATLCSEALALYVKSLTLLQKSMDLAARYWQRRGGTGIASARLNNAVQWGRERFNETLEKADFVKSKIPSNVRDAHIAPEKLIYDRALEMSRAAAVNELVGEDLPGCESSYETSIIMLEALLEQTFNVDSDGQESSTDTLDKEDRQTIEKFIQSIRKRLEALRRKIDFASQRNSPTPSIERSDRDQVRRTSSGSTGSSAGVVRGGVGSSESPISTPSTPVLPKSPPTPTSVPSTS